MASPSSLSSRNWSYNVFVSFHGPDVRKTLLSHLRERFKRNGITMFDDQEIKRSATIGPSLTEAIRESRISIVILSKKYASSSWCLDELVEIFECKTAAGQIVMTVFYGVEPSDVRKQTGEFGIAFNETCASKTEDQRQKWSKALKDVGNIAGEDFFRWDNEAKMIKKIARDVSDQLNATPSRDFDDMVGLEAQMRRMKSLLKLDYDGVMMIGIYGHAGIGKSTIARCLQSLLSNRFQLTCFVENLRESYPIGLTEYSLKLHLQEQLLSNILNQDGIRICHLGVIKERLHDKRVLIVLDGVNSLKQLEALAGDISWFGPGSRIVVTTEDQELLQQHGINRTYQVQFPSDRQALEILCRYAFRQSYPHDGFKKLAQRVTELCGNLPLGLSVVGSSLREKNEDGWEEAIRKLETVLDRGIQDVISVGYQSLDENEQMLFLHIAVFFNYKDVDLVTDMLVDSNLDAKQGFEILVNKSLIYISSNREIVMHKFLQQLGTEVVRREDFWKRRILKEASEICDVLERAKGTRAVSGISFDISGINEVSISQKAFKRMQNLQFLRVYKSRDDGNNKMLIPELMEFPDHLKLLHWPAYPNKCLPPTFHPEYLVELNMKHSQLEYLWHGTQPLPNLKELDLSWSWQLKELPDLLHAKKLEIVYLNYCESLVKLPSSCSHLPKLNELWMVGCVNVEVITAHLNLASLEFVYTRGCSVISTHTAEVYVSQTAVEDVPATSIRLFSHLRTLDLSINGKLKDITHLPTSLTTLNPSTNRIETIREFIEVHNGLERLTLSTRRRFQSPPELPCSLILLKAETISTPLNLAANAMFLYFTNCFKLGQQARRAITQHAQREIAQGISGISDVKEVSTTQRAYKTMPNFPIQFLSVYKKKYDGTYKMHKMEFPPGLRLHLEAYPTNCLFSTINLEYLVKLNMVDSHVENLWQGIQPLKLEKLELVGCERLEVIPSSFWNLPELVTLRIEGCINLRLPDLSNATKLKKLELVGCERLEVIPSSFWNIPELVTLRIESCINLRLLDLSNATKLKKLELVGCERLEVIPSSFWNIPELVTLRIESCINLRLLDLSNATKLEKLELVGCERLEVTPSSFWNLRELVTLRIEDCINLQVIPAHMNLASLANVYMNGGSQLTNLLAMSTNIRRLYLPETTVEDLSAAIRLCSGLQSLAIRNSDMERIPDSIRNLHALQHLILNDCRRLASLPKLPRSLTFLSAYNCKALETVFSPFDQRSLVKFNFANCFKLGQQARRDIIGQSFRDGIALLPGREVPAEFNHRARGNSLIIRLDGNSQISFLKVCLVISHNHNFSRSHILFRSTVEAVVENFCLPETYGEHLFFFSVRLPEVNGDIVFESICRFGDVDIIEWGAMILTEETFGKSYETESNEASLYKWTNL